MIGLWTAGEKLSWFSGDGDICVQNVRASLSAFQAADSTAAQQADAADDVSAGAAAAADRQQHVPLVARIGALCKGVEKQQDVPAARQALMESGKWGNTGIMLAQLASSPTAYLPPEPVAYKQLTLPSGMVDLDVRGSIEVSCSWAHFPACVCGVRWSSPCLCACVLGCSRASVPFVSSPAHCVHARSAGACCSTAPLILSSYARAAWDVPTRPC